MNGLVATVLLQLPFIKHMCGAKPSTPNPDPVNGLVATVLLQLPSIKHMCSAQSSTLKHCPPDACKLSICSETERGAWMQSGMQRSALPDAIGSTKRIPLEVKPKLVASVLQWS